MELWELLFVGLGIYLFLGARLAVESHVPDLQLNLSAVVQMQDSREAQRAPAFLAPAKEAHVASGTI